VHLADALIHTEVEDSAHAESRDTVAREEVIDVGGVASEEFEGVGVVEVDRLRHVNNVELAPEIEHVVLREVAVHELAPLVEHAHAHEAVVICLRHLVARELCVPQPRCRLAVLAYEFHQHQMHPKQQRLRTRHATRLRIGALRVGGGGSGFGVEGGCCCCCTHGYCA
jgi:hypothetical protein